MACTQRTYRAGKRAAEADASAPEEWEGLDSLRFACPRDSWMAVSMHFCPGVFTLGSLALLTHIVMQGPDPPYAPAGLSACGGGGA